MATFYLMPPRRLLGERFAAQLRALFPGLDWDSATWPNLADALAAAATCHPDVYVVFREELPDGEDLRRALEHGFGAEAGDVIVEVKTGVRPGEMTARRWRLGEAA